MQPSPRYSTLGLSFIGAFVLLSVGLQLPCFSSPAELMSTGQAAPHADSGTVRLWISALENNHPVQDLEKDELKLWVGKEEQNISSLIFEPPVPLVLGLVIDASGSIKAAWPGPELKLAPDFFQRVLRSGDKAFIVDFSTQGYVDADPTADLAQLTHGLEKVRALHPYGGTALYDAIATSSDLLKPSAGTRHLLVVVTDGIDNASRYTQLEALRVLRLAGTTVCFIGRTPGPPEYTFYTEQRHHGLDAMHNFAQATGGLLVLASPGEKAMGRALDRVAEFVRGQYALDFEAGSTISEGDKIKIKCLRQHVTIVMPERY